VTENLIQPDGPLGDVGGWLGSLWTIWISTAVGLALVFVVIGTSIARARRRRALRVTPQYRRRFSQRDAG
jgi:hypothetical protein